MSTELKIFSALTLFIGVIVVVIVGSDIYLHPPGPNQVGTATIEISRTGRFNGVVGTDTNHYTIEGTAPATVKVPYALDEYVVANIEQDSGGVEIRVKKKTVEKGANTMLVWKPPRSGS